MKIPKGRVWQDCRYGALQGIPSGSFCPLKDPITLYNWRARGSYHIISITPKKFTFESAAADVGSAVLGDIESLFNHLAEHRALVYHAVHTSNWYSPSWLLVTIYYWGLFAALIWSRLLGKGVLYLGSEAIRDLKMLHGGNHEKISPGSYHLEIDKSISATSISFALVKLKENNFHECVWKHIFKDAKRKFDELADEEADQDEYRIYKSLTFLDTLGNRAWPSELRNLVNYRSGFSYNALKNQPAFPLVNKIKRYTFDSCDSLITELELAIGQISSTSNVAFHPSIYCNILFLQTVLLTVLCEELYGEILERHKLDSRWGLRRKNFYEDLGLIRQDCIWPVRN